MDFESFIKEAINEIQSKDNKIQKKKIVIEFEIDWNENIGKVKQEITLAMSKDSIGLFKLGKDIEKFSGLTLKDAEKSKETPDDAYVYGLCNTMNDGKDIFFWTNGTRLSGAAKKSSVLEAIVEQISHECVHLTRLVLSKHIFEKEYGNKWYTKDLVISDKKGKNIIDEESFATAEGLLAQQILPYFLEMAKEYIPQLKKLNLNESKKINVKKIILTENQYRLLLKEASGVPNNIINVASQIYNQFIKDLKNDEQLIYDFNNTKFKINRNFEIGDVTFKDSYINLILIGGGDEITRYRFSVNPKDYQYFTNDLKLKPKNETLPIIIDLEFMVSSDTTVKDFKNHLISNETEYLPTIAHEIKHAYDLIKIPKPNIGSMANYAANITMSDYEFEDFFYNLYYIENVENLVRPTEIITKIEKLGITKKDFLTFITSNEVVTQLKKIQSFSFDDLYNSILKERLEKNKNRRELNHYTLEYTPLPPKEESEIIQELNNDLDEIFQIHKRKRVESFIIILEELFDTKEIPEEIKKNAIEKFEKDTNKLFGGNSANFYREAEKLMKTKSTEVLRKIYGLYALTKDNPDNVKNNQKIFKR